MPVSFIQQLQDRSFDEGGAVLILWHITENHEQLKTLIHSGLQDKHSRGSIENIHWLASRAALLHLFPGRSIEIIKDEFLKPHLDVQGESVFVSITHSFGYAAVMISKTAPVALDLEKTDPRIQRVMHKFCNEDELAFAAGPDEAAVLTVIWSAKETLYKFYSKKELDFRKHLSIRQFAFQSAPFTISGRINKESYDKTFRIFVSQIEQYILTYIY